MNRNQTRCRSVQRQLVWLTILLCVVVTISCEDRHKNAAPLNVSFEWNPPCTPVARSPRIIVDHVPNGTVRWYVELIDLDLPAFDHGSGFVDADGSTVIAAGAVGASYKGPSPPYGVIHDYQIVVMARNSQNQTIGIGKSSLRYPPAGEEEVRWRPCN